MHQLQMPALHQIGLHLPPYPFAEAVPIQPAFVKRNKVMAALAGCRAGTHVVWLDQVLPMYRKDEWAIEAVIGMVKSTNHRFRMITIFRRLDAPNRVDTVPEPDTTNSN